MKVLGIGEVVADNVYRVNDMSLTDQQPCSQQVQHCLGGPVPIALILLARLGVNCTLLASIGTDEQGEDLKKELRHERVHLLTQHQPATKSNIILVDEKTGNRKKMRGSVTHAPLRNLKTEFLRQFDVILIDRHEPQALYEVLQKKAPHTRLVIDPSTEISALTLDMLKHAEYPIVPIEGVLKIDGGSTLFEKIKALYAMSRKEIIVTAGSLGTILYDGKTIEIIPSMDIRAQDTNGAGDVFRAGVIYGVLRKWDIRKSIKMGNVVAALQCLKPGNSTAIPTKREIIRAAKSLRPKHIEIRHLEAYCQELG